MDGITSTSSTPGRPTPLLTKAARESVAASSSATVTAPPAPTDTVTVTKPLNGHDPVMTRLFGRAPGDPEPTVRRPGVSTPGNGNGREFLTMADRAFLASAYEMAQQHDIDLTSIDQIASDMGHIRFMADALPANAIRDIDGNPIPIKFTAEDKANVDRIAASPAMNDTTFPKDLLGCFMDPGRTWLHASDYRDLEAVVNAMSPATVEAIAGGVKAIFDKAKTYPQSGPPDTIPTLDQATIERKLGMNRGTPELSERDKKTVAVLSLLEGRQKDHIANLFALVALTGQDPAIVDAFAARLSRTAHRDQSQGTPARVRIDTRA